MWSLFGGKGTTVTCWFCNQKTQLSRSDDASAETPDDWRCTKCDNQNTTDKHGNIVDSRDEMYQESPVPLRQALLPRSAAEEKKRRVFCDGCQRNQELVRQILSSYLPDEEDPEYSDRLENAEKYADQLRRRYPLVCGSCQRRVDERLQQQAQWVYRRELANALKKSASARNAAPLMRVQPTLRKKGMVATWLVCALVALVICPLAAWTWYACAFLGRLPDPALSVCAALLLALVTHLSRLLNPLWLYLACNPGMRVSGLPMYKRRVTYLACLRLAAACLRTASLPSLVWIAIAAADISLCLLAAFTLRTRSWHRSRLSKSSRPSHLAQASGSDRPESVPSADPQQTFASFQKLSFGMSEANMDQDDTLAGLSTASSQSSQWTRRPSFKRRLNNRFRTGSASISSDEDDEQGGDAGHGYDNVASDLMAGLDTISFGSQGAKRSDQRDAEDMEVDLVSLMSNAGTSAANNKASSSGVKSRSYAAGSPPRPFEAFRFQRQNSTGLEQKMSSFSLSDSDDDGDDGSYQGLFGSTAMDNWLLGSLQRLGTVQGAAAIGFVCTLLMGGLLPLWAFWIERMLLIAVAGLAMVSRKRRHGVPRSSGFRKTSRLPGSRMQPPSLSTSSSSLALRRAAGCALILLLAGIPIVLTSVWSADAAAMWSLSEAIKTVGTADLALAELVSPGNAAMLLRWPLAKRSIAAMVQRRFFHVEPAHLPLIPESLSAHGYVLAQADYAVELLCVIFGLMAS